MMGKLSGHSAGLVIFTNDLSGLEAFYSRLLSMRVLERGEGFVTLSERGLDIVLHSTADARKAAMKTGSYSLSEKAAIKTGSVSPREQVALKPVFYVDDLAACRVTAGTLGGQVGDEAAEWLFHGARVCDGHDPDGNIFQLRQHAPAG